DQHLTSEVKNMPAANHRDDVRKIEDHFFLYGIDVRGKAPKGRIAKATISCNGGGRELIGLGKLPSQLCREALVQSGIDIVIELVSETYSGLVYRLGADVPHVCDLRVIAVCVDVFTANWTRVLRVLNGWTVSLRIGDRESVRGRN